MKTLKRVIGWLRPATKSDVAEILQRLATNERLLRALLTLGVHDMLPAVAAIQEKADAIIAAVTLESQKDDAIIALVNGQTALIGSLRQELADALANGAATADLEAVLDKLTAAEASSLANAQKVLDAVNANTPSAPPADAAPDASSPSAPSTTDTPAPPDAVPQADGQ